MSQLKAAFLDYASLDQNDLDFRPLNAAFSELQLYDTTSSDQVLTRLTNVEVAIVNKVVLSAETIQQLPKLKLILISATGTNNVDLKAAQAQGIVVCNCQGYGTASVAQHALALMLALATNVVKYNQAVQQGRLLQFHQDYL